MVKKKRSGITAPEGYMAAGIHCGIKKRKLDLGLLVSDAVAKAAGVFTLNKLKSPHIEIDKAHIKKGRVKAILVNSGNANCYNGKKGRQDALKLIAAAAKEIGVSDHEVLFASTGVIAQPLPVKKMLAKLPQLGDKLDSKRSSEFAHAILTTDKKEKQAALKTDIYGKKITLGGCLKGSGMIQPSMATTLCFITTDADIEKNALNRALKEAVDQTLNLVTVDGDMSPNDSVIILANGQAGNKTIKLNTPSYKKFYKALIELLSKLSYLLVDDAEGATKILRIKVEKAKTCEDAKKVAFNIANSSLVKTAAYGQDPNWGRIVSAVGSAGAYIKPEAVELKLADQLIFKNLKPAAHDKRKLSAAFRRKNIDITVVLNTGRHEIEVLGCDLTRDYVSLNANYRT